MDIKVSVTCQNNENSLYEGMPGKSSFLNYRPLSFSNFSYSIYFHCFQSALGMTSSSRSKTGRERHVVKATAQYDKLLVTLQYQQQ
jgi:hypothetical protein